MAPQRMLALIPHPTWSLAVGCLRQLCVRWLLLAKGSFWEMDTAVNTKQPVFIAAEELVPQPGKKGSGWAPAACTAIVDIKLQHFQISLCGTCAEVTKVIFK